MILWKEILSLRANNPYRRRLSLPLDNTVRVCPFLSLAMLFGTMTMEGVSKIRPANNWRRFPARMKM
jgi:hypothetical protein